MKILYPILLIRYILILIKIYISNHPHMSPRGPHSSSQRMSVQMVISSSLFKNKKLQQYNANSIDRKKNQQHLHSTFHHLFISSVGYYKVWVIIKGGSE